VRLKAAINGASAAGSHPALPVTPEEMAAAARSARAAGADAIHLHVRDAGGEESLAGDDVATVLTAVRAACPGVPIGVSTGAWIVSDPAQRLRAIEGWRLLPDFASVNFHEARAFEVAELLLSRGVGVEAGLWHLPAADLLVASGLAPRCLRVLIEPMQPDVESALANATAIAAALDRARVDAPRLLHGTEETAWPLLRAAAERGLATRIGLEDVFELPDGALAPDNAALVRAARAILDDVVGR
jgi:uncharacterized protein (DUF849 family)